MKIIESTSDANSEVAQKKAQVIFELFMIYLSIFTISVLLNELFNGSSSSNYQWDFIKLILVLLAAMIAIIVIHFKVLNYRLQNLLYLLLAIGITQVIYKLTYQRHILSVTFTVIIMLTIILTTFNRKLIIAYTFMAVLSFFMSTYTIRPTSVLIGRQYVYTAIETVLILGFSYLRLLNLFNWYNHRLKDENNKLQDSNIALAEINAMYLSTEEELMAQYEETTTLYQENQLLLDQQNAIFEATAEGVIEYNLQTGDMHVSPRAMTILGVSEENFSIDFMNDHLSLEDQETFTRSLDKMINKEHRKERLELNYRHSNGYINLRLTLLYYSSSNTNDAYILMNLLDFTLEKDQGDRIYYQAYYDSLTNLFNRTGIIHTIEDSFIANGAPFHLMLIDIDNFKYFNDTFGHKVGDSLIQDIANVLKSTIPEDAYIGRLGSDDFLLLLPGDTDLMALIADINNNRHNFVYEDTEFSINYSIGVASSKPNLPAVEIISFAELAMYKVKEFGKNSYAFFDYDYSEEMRYRLMLSNALDRSMRSGEIFMNYQPIINGRSEELIGFEALVRWDSSKFGIVPPSDFIPLAEKTGFINPLGNYILSEVCLFANKLYLIDPSLYVSVNVSSKQLHTKGFYEDFIGILEQHQTKPTQIIMEITESAVIFDYRKTTQIITKLKEKGIIVYLDDFGTGYSSLTHLNQLPIDLIKIDKSFIDQIHKNERDYIMVSNIIHMANSFNLKLIAEGVELKVQSEALIQLGCPMMQGYYFSKPLSTSNALTLASKDS